MFLLLASSLHTGKRPGFYCPRGQRSQDAPKGLKEEQRGWRVEHDKEVQRLLSTHTQTHTHDQKHKSETAAYSQRLLLCGSFKSLLSLSGNEIMFWLLHNCTSWLLFSYPCSSCVHFCFLSAFFDLFQNLSHPKKSEIQSAQ